MRVVVLAWVVGAAFAPAAAAQDGGDARALQVARAADADRAEAACRPAEALAAWRAAEAAASGTRLARRAADRIADLVAHDEGGFAPLAELCARRRDALRTGRAGWLAYARTLDATPPGPVRREGRAVVAESLERLGDVAGARAAWESLAREPDATALERRRAAEGVARAETARGDLAGGVRALRDAGLGGSSAARALERERSRRVGRVVAWSLVALFVLAAVAAGGRRLGPALVRAVTPGRLALAAWSLGVPLLLAWRFDAEALDTFSTFAVAGGALLLLSAATGAATAPSRGRRAALAAGSALAVLAVGYLVLDRAGALIDLGL